MLSDGPPRVRGQTSNTQYLGSSTTEGREKGNAELRSTT